jgi:hypothetical protein
MQAAPAKVSSLSSSATCPDPLSQVQQTPLSKSNMLGHSGKPPVLTFYGCTRAEGMLRGHVQCPKQLARRSLREFQTTGRSLGRSNCHRFLFAFLAPFCGYSVMAGHIVALGGGGFSMEPDNLALDRYILSLWRDPGRAPRVCFIPTATGDSADYIGRFYSAFEKLPCRPMHLTLTWLTVWCHGRARALIA